MKLASLLRAMEPEEHVQIVDANAPVDRMQLFEGTVEGAACQWFRNGIVELILREGDGPFHILINVEYQKKRRINPCQHST